jgi:hypothetical protein
MCSRDCAGFVVDVEMRSVFWSCRRRIELLMEQMVMDFVDGWRVGEEWCGLGLVVIFEGKTKFGICSKVENPLRSTFGASLGHMRADLNAHYTRTVISSPI